jgi:hypothetical protein
MQNDFDVQSTYDEMLYETNNKHSSSEEAVVDYGKVAKDVIKKLKSIKGSLTKDDKALLNSLAKVDDDMSAIDLVIDLSNFEDNNEDDDVIEYLEKLIDTL